MTTDLAVQANIEELVIRTNDTLQINGSSALKAVEAGKMIIAEIQREGMSDQMDEKCNNYLVKLRKTASALEERRKPITQLFDQIKASFTTLERTIDIKSETYTTIQGHRDNYARIKAEEQRKREQEARRKLEIERERADVISKMESALDVHFTHYLSSVKRNLMEKFNRITLENYPDLSTEIANVSTRYPIEHFESFNINLTMVYLSDQDKVRLREEAMMGKYSAFLPEFAREITDFKTDLIAKLPSKRRELDEILMAEKRDKQEAERLKSERLERERLENERLAQQTKDREQKAIEEASGRKQEAEMNSLFEAASEASVIGVQPSVRKTLKIEVLNPAGYVQLFQVWFEAEGMKLPMDQIEKKTVAQMKAYCEKLASKDGEMINSRYLRYEEEIKTVAKAR